MTATAWAGPAVLRPDEVRRLMAAPDRRTKNGKRDAALLAVLVGGGLRIGEACGLVVNSVEIAAGGLTRLTFPTSKCRKGATPQIRTVTLPLQAGRLVRAWLASAGPRQYLFEGHKCGPLGVRRAQKIVARWLDVIGRSDLHTHSLRHTFGSIVTRETQDIFVTAKLLGHKDLRTTVLHYAAFENRDADAAARAVGSALSRRGRRTGS